MAKRLKVTPAVVKKKVEQLHEFNPMLGHRGCRLAVTYPAIARMQARAIIEAALNVKKTGRAVLPEIMIPLAGAVEELKLVKDEIIDEIETVFKERKARIKYMVGTMIEVPRAALTADEIATEAQFFSFGTNDLTQTTNGLSRDDFNAFFSDYNEFDLLEQNPFKFLGEQVKELIKLAIDRGRLTRPDIIMGLCGEHGAEPANIPFVKDVGLNYVSCSPYGIPIAKLAIAQLNLKLSN
ncbi:Pyruvate, phosphate dikinase [subsurface metagenome]